MYGGQRAACGSRSSASVMLVLVMELRPSGLAAPNYPGGSGKPSSLWRAPFPGWDPGRIRRESQLSTSIRPSLLPDSEWGVSSCLRLLTRYLPATMRYAFYSELKQKLLSFKWLLAKLEYLFP